MSREENRAPEKPLPLPLSKQDILRDFEKLIQEKKLFGVELDPTILRKSGKGARFLVSRVPPRAQLLRRWARLFGNAISPCALFEALSARIHGQRVTVRPEACS